MEYEQKMRKTVEQYAGMYRDTLQRHNIPDADKKTADYKAKLAGMYATEEYRRRESLYPTMQMSKIYAVVAMCLMLQSYGCQKEEIFDIVNGAFRKLKALLYGLEKVIDSTPLAWPIARKWNLNEYANRQKDGSITFELFDAEPDRIEYKINGCQYVAVFESFGIREMCKIFCMTDTQAYANLTRHVRFERYSDLSDGTVCWDVVSKK